MEYIMAGKSYKIIGKFRTTQKGSNGEALFGLRCLYENNGFSCGFSVLATNAEIK